MNSSLQQRVGQEVEKDSQESLHKERRSDLGHATKIEGWLYGEKDIPKRRYSIPKGREL